jgi:protease-4
MSLIGGIFIGMFLIIFIIVVLAIFGDPQMMPGDKVAVVKISGPIYSSQGMIELLKKCRDNDSIKAIVLRINSPGGGVASVQEIHKELTRLDKKIVVSMGSTAASGGYYIACTADRIFANPGTLTGSIGVIMQFPRIEGLMKKLGVEREVLKSGKYKDSGSMYREFTAEERELFQATIDDVYEQFLAAILEGRKHVELTREQLVEIADGRIMSGKQAMENNLIDELGDLDDAIEYAGKLAGIKGKPRTIEMQVEKPFLERFMRGSLGNKMDQVIPGQPVLRYELM